MTQAGTHLDTLSQLTSLYTSQLADLNAMTRPL
jgi:hypothetical protein